MRKTASMLGVVATSAGMMAAGGPMALADDEGGDGVRVLDNTNVQVAPIQVCNNNITVVGIVGELVVPSDTDCSNAPTSDGAQQTASDQEKAAAEQPAEQEQPAEEEDSAAGDALSSEIEDGVEDEVPNEEDLQVDPQEPAVDDADEQQSAEDGKSGEDKAAQQPAAEPAAEPQPIAEDSAQQPVAEELPQAPAPTVIEGHLPVTG